MKSQKSYTVIDGIKCYHPEVANSYDDYPEDGFDMMDKNEERSFWVDSRTRLFKQLVGKYKSSKARTKYLEIGCANGDFIRSIEGLDWLDITGSEVYIKGLINASKISGKSQYVQYDITKGPLGEVYDMITAFDVIEHLDDDEAAIKNMCQMLDADGVLMVSVPQYMYLWSGLDEIVMHKRRYSRKELVDIMSRNELVVEYCTSFVFALFPLMLLSRIMDRKSKDEVMDMNRQEFEKRVNIPKPLNMIFDYVMRLDEWLIKKGISLPYGGTLIVISRKRK